ncbi:transglycosylase domain-containing protein [Piscinibacter sakaiensis]|uniref:transglycosylase domain-containing protein n=1 Tax=Piscinibacter sakaiensis TaxID=1547922 RepID=UPI003AB0E60E
MPPDQGDGGRLSRWLVRGGMAAAAMLASAALGLLWLWNTTPDARAIVERVNAQPSLIVSADGELLDTIGNNQSVPVALDQVAPAIVQALLATEDRRFHQHGGIDLRRIVAAAGHTLRGDIQGASTLTQQLARNLFPKRIGNERSLLRKLRELVVALKIEQAYTKQQILALYLNNVPFLYDVVGIEMAARTYFAKPASEIAAHEAALLVAMLKGPSQYDPERRPERARARRDLVLRLMAREGVLGQTELAAAHAQPLGVQITRHDLEPQLAAHYLRVVRAQVAQWAGQHGIDPRRDGLRIQVGLDARLQRIAEAAVERQTELLQQVADSEWSSRTLRAGPPKKPAGEQAFAYFWQSNPALLAELQQPAPGLQPVAAGRPSADSAPLAELKAAKTRLEAGFVALDPQTGSVRAYVGSRSWKLDRFDHVAQARRQPGSTFKPFVYGAALAGGMPQNRMFADRPFTMTLADGATWTPGDVGSSSGEWMMMRAGLSKSRNSITAQVMHQVGVDRVIQYARAVGIRHSPLDPVPSLALGTSPVTLLEMAGAYGTLAALGTRRDPTLIEAISARDGRLLVRFESQPQQVLEHEHAAAMVDILRDAVDRGTGTRLRSQFGIKADIAGKSGTSQRNADGWFISLQPNLVTGAWVGFNDQRVTMRSTEWGQGGRSALLLVGDFLREARDRDLLAMDFRFPQVARPKPPMLWQPAPAPFSADDGDDVAGDEGHIMAPVHRPRPSAPYLLVGDDAPQQPAPEVAAGGYAADRGMLRTAAAAAFAN